MMLKIKKDDSFDKIVSILSDKKLFDEMWQDFIVFGETKYLLYEEGQNICIIYPINSDKY